MNIFSINWWISMFLTTLLTMVFIYLIKKFTTAVNVPILSDVAQAV